MATKIVNTAKHVHLWRVITQLLFDLGPDFWGLVNPDWNLCSRGQHQSPVDIDPERLLYDPHLPPLRMDRQKVRTQYHNSLSELFTIRLLISRQKRPKRVSREIVTCERSENNEG